MTFSRINFMFAAGVVSLLAGLSFLVPIYGAGDNRDQSAEAAMTTPAFPGAEGFGAYATGGRGGQVIYVTNLNDSGAGSLRAAVETEGPRIVVFGVGGTIELFSNLKIKDPDITIAGQTAPGGGIALKNHPSNDGPAIEVSTSNVILRYLRVRPGPSAVSSCCVDAIAIASRTRTVKDVIIDHCSLSWATDEVVSTWFDSSDVTVQWSIIAEGLDDSTHTEGPHSKGVLIGDQSTRVSLHHNLLAHNVDRNPRVKGGDVDYVNNVIYNAQRTPVRSDNKDNITSARFNLIGNFFKYGPDSTWPYEITIQSLSSVELGAYVHDNLGPNRPVDSLPDDAVVDPDDREFLVSSRYNFPPVFARSPSSRDFHFGSWPPRFYVHSLLNASLS